MAVFYTFGVHAVHGRDNEHTLYPRLTKSFIKTLYRNLEQVAQQAPLLSEKVNLR